MSKPKFEVSIYPDYIFWGGRFPDEPPQVLGTCRPALLEGLAYKLLGQWVGLRPAVMDRPEEVVFVIFLGLDLGRNNPRDWAVPAVVFHGRDDDELRPHPMWSWVRVWDRRAVVGRPLFTEAGLGAALCNPQPPPVYERDFLERLGFKV